MGRPGKLTPVIDALDKGQTAEFPLEKWDSVRSGAYCTRKRTGKIFSVNRFGNTILVTRNK